MHNDLFTLADGRDARLPTSIGSKILLRRESTAGDTRINGHRRKVTEPALLIFVANSASCGRGNDASGGVDRARAGDLYQGLTGIPFGKHVCGRPPGRGVGKRLVEKHLLSAWSEPHRDRRIEIVAAAAVEREGRLHGVFAGVYPPVSHGGKAIIVSVMGEPNEGAVEVGEAGDVAVGGIDCAVGVGLIDAPRWFREWIANGLVRNNCAGAAAIRQPLQLVSGAGSGGQGEAH